MSEAGLLTGIKNKKGILFVMVLAAVIVALTLGAIFLTFFTSESKVTHHQLSRIQAYYVAMAGVNYAFERIWNGSWQPSTCPSPTGCVINDTNFPNSTHQQFRVIFCPAGSTCAGSNQPCTTPQGINYCIYSTVNYTFTPP